MCSKRQLSRHNSHPPPSLPTEFPLPSPLTPTPSSLSPTYFQHSEQHVFHLRCLSPWRNGEMSSVSLKGKAFIPEGQGENENVWRLGAKRRSSATEFAYHFTYPHPTMLHASPTIPHSCVLYPTCLRMALVFYPACLRRTCSWHFVTWFSDFRLRRCEKWPLFFLLATPGVWNTPKWWRMAQYCRRRNHQFNYMYLKVKLLIQD
jgi:hypothetical protein